MKKILGLDLGTNSIGWALVDKDNQEILGMGSRIIPMGKDKIDYEKGDGVTKSAMRRAKRSTRRMNKRYKLRRNKLLYILHTLGMLPEQFQFKKLNEKDKDGSLLRLNGTKENNSFKETNNGIPVPTKIQELELLPISKKTLQADSISFCQLKVDALTRTIDIKDFGRILYNFNQLRGYSGGDSDERSKKENDEEESLGNKNYEVIIRKVGIISVEKSEDTFKIRGGKNKGQQLNKFIVVISLDDQELEGTTELQDFKKKVGQEEELQITTKRDKNGEVTSRIITLPQKSDWRKEMEANEKILKEDRLFISELKLRDLQNNGKWTKIRNRVFLRNRYKEEFDKMWDTQAQKYNFLKECPKETLEKIANYIFPGKSESQQKLRKNAIEGGLKYIIKDQIIYYQRPLKPQTELISNCRFEKSEKVIAVSHPLFQEFRCWKQINNLYITSKQQVWNEKKKKNVWQYTNRYLTNEQKQRIYEKLQNQKGISFNEVKKIVEIKDDKIEYLNGLHVKARLIGCDTLISIKKQLGDYAESLLEKDISIIEKIWDAIFDVRNHEGSEYDITSKRVTPIFEILKEYLDDSQKAEELALKLAQKVKFVRKYGSLSAKAIQKVLPLMQLNPQNISEQITDKFNTIKNFISTGEILDNTDYNFQDYVIDFVEKNPNALENGGLMEYLAISLAYDKHTAETMEAQISNYHDINYEKRNLRNPIVEQLMNETMQVVKAIWKQYNIDTKELEIRIELARDLKNSAKERKAIYDGQSNNQKENNKTKERLKENQIALTSENILKYRLYAQQKETSPYTGKPIDFSKLFDNKEYDIDHILPKSRYYDDSFSNKVICEKNINEEKSNRTAWEYISQQNSKHEILPTENFIKHVNNNYFGKKKKNLLAEKIPTNPVSRQLKDTQYISIAVKNELAKIVGSENIKTSTGEITDFLRSRWGLKKLFMEMTEERFKRMELWDLDENGNPTTTTKWVTKEVMNDGEKDKNVYEIKNWSKRYDHRHHAIDALIVALTEQSHIQRLNNLNKYVQDQLERRKEEFKITTCEDETVFEAFCNLEEGRRDEILQKMESSRYFEKPFLYTNKKGEIVSSLCRQVKEHLETMIISQKPKDKLSISEDTLDPNTPNKKLKKQLKIRAAIHEDTYYGKTNERDTKRIKLSALSASDIDKIIDKSLASEIKEHKKKYIKKEDAFIGEGLKEFNDNRIKKNKQPVYNVKVWYNKNEKKKDSLQRLYDNNEKQSVITGDNYLFIVMEKETKKGVSRVFDIAPLYDSVALAKEYLKEGKRNFKQLICEDYRLKHTDKPQKVLFYLQQNDLVYLPTSSNDPVLNMTNNELKEWLNKDCENKKSFARRIYKVVKMTGKNCFFIPNNYATTISTPKDLSKEDLEKLHKEYKDQDKDIPKHKKNYEEFGSFGSSIKTEINDNFVKELVLKEKFDGNQPIKIQDTCLKLKIDWLGNIEFA